jgi:hypothetical protein
MIQDVLCLKKRKINNDLLLFLIKDNTKISLFFTTKSELIDYSLFNHIFLSYKEVIFIMIENKYGVSFDSINKEISIQRILFLMKIIK